MSASISALEPELQPFARDLVDAAGAAGLGPRVTSTRRSHAEQERLYRRYLAGQQPYPVARPGTSAHEFGWAFDLVVSPMDALGDVGIFWESMGGVWGGHPTRGSYDPVHFEYPGWRELVDFSQPSTEQRGLGERAENLFASTVAGFLPGGAWLLSLVPGEVIANIADPYRAAQAIARYFGIRTLR